MVTTFAGDNLIPFSSLFYTILRGSSILVGVGNLYLTQIISSAMWTTSDWIWSMSNVGEWWYVKLHRRGGGLAVGLRLGGDVWVTPPHLCFPLIHLSGAVQQTGLGNSFSWKRHWWEKMVISWLGSPRTPQAAGTLQILLVHWDKLAGRGFQSRTQSIFSRRAYPEQNCFISCSCSKQSVLTLCFAALLGLTDLPLRMWSSERITCMWWSLTLRQLLTRQGSLTAVFHSQAMWMHLKSC